MRDSYAKDEDIKSGIAFCLINWKTIVLVALIFAVAMAFVGKLRQGNNEVEAVEYEEQLEKARGDLSESEAQNVEQISTQYKFYNNKREYWDSYMKNSAFQNLDPYNYVKKDIQYAVTSDNSRTINAFLDTILNEEDYQKIGELLGLDSRVSSLQELVYISEIKENSEAAQSGPYTTYLNISVAAEDEEKALGIQAIVENAIGQKSENLQRAGIKLSVTKVDDMTTLSDANWLAVKQREYFNNMLTLQTNWNDFVSRSVNNLTESQKAYLELLLSDESEKSEEKEESSEMAAPSSAGSIIKFAVVGGILGLLLAFVAVYMIYLFSGKIRSEEELCGTYKLPVLQRFKIGAKKADPIVNKGYAMLSPQRVADSVESGVEALSNEIQRITDKTPYKRICLVYDCDDESVRSAADKIAASLSKNGIEVTSGNPHADQAAYRQLTESDAVIIAETLNKSGKTKLKALIDECKWKDIPVIGYVTLIHLC